MVDFLTQGCADFRRFILINYFEKFHLIYRYQHILFAKKDIVL